MNTIVHVTTGQRQYNHLSKEVYSGCGQPFSIDVHVRYLHGWGVHEVKGEEVIDAHSLEREDSLREVCPLDLRDCRG